MNINIFGNEAYETYIIDTNTVGIRPKWHDVKVSFPNYPGDYLCYGKNGIGIERYYNHMFFGENDQSDDEVTHWMILPERP
jgi:hypothetical protein